MPVPTPPAFHRRPCTPPTDAMRHGEWAIHLPHPRWLRTHFARSRRGQRVACHIRARSTGHGGQPAVTDGDVELLGPTGNSPSTAHARLIDLWSCLSRAARSTVMHYS